jgi:hypothetical protein
VFVQSFPLYVKLSKSNSREGPGWLNEVGRWIYQLIQAYHQYGVGSLPALLITKGCTRLAAASDKVYQLLAHGRWFSLLGMCETFLNEEKCKKNSRELVD